MDKAALVIELNAAELAVRMCEASYGLTRPCPDPAEALAIMDKDCRDSWLRAAVVAMEYFRDACNAGQRPS